MTPRKTKTLRMPPPPAEPLRLLNPHAAGIDVPAAEHWAAVPPGRGGPPPAEQPAGRPTSAASAPAPPTWRPGPTG
jgi:hypothetical protein